MATNQNSTHKWQARAAKLASATTIASLKPAACEQRARFAQSTMNAVAADAMLAPRITIYCSRTGTMLGSFNEFVTAALNQLPADNASAAAEMFNAHRFYHPAWLDTSPASLAQLQRMFPNEYVVYAAHELQHDDNQTSGDQRANILTWLLSNELPHVVEAAELLRRVLAIIGQYRTLRALPTANTGNAIGLESANWRRKAPIVCPTIADYTMGCVTDYILALREYFTLAVKRLQAEFHVQSVYRQKQVTMSDIRRISMTVGRQQFKLARDKTINFDNAAFSDIAEIFADSSELDITITSKQMEKHKPAKYSGNVYSSLDAITADVPDTIDAPETLPPEMQAEMATEFANAFDVEPVTLAPLEPIAPASTVGGLKIKLFRKA